MKLSIITTIYKAEKDLPRLLDSMVSLKSPNLEFFLIINGSPDRSGEISEKYAKKDSRFKILSLENNIGYIGARNLGLSRVDADYVGFCDSDDYLEPNGYDKAIKVIESSKTDLLITGYNVVYAAKTIRKTLPYDNKIYIDEEVEEIILPPMFGKLPNGQKKLDAFMWKQVFKLSIIRTNNIKFSSIYHPCEDIIFNIDYSRCCSHIIIDSDIILYNYVQNANSITSQLLENYNYLDDWQRVKELHLAQLERAKTDIELQITNSTLLSSIFNIANRLNVSQSHSTIKTLSTIINNIIDDDLRNNIINNCKPYDTRSRILKMCVYLHNYSILFRLLRLTRIIKR